MILKEMPGGVAVVGSMNADIMVRTPHLPQPGETISGYRLNVRPGGKSANQAKAAGLLGAQVYMVGAMGKDDNSLVITDSLLKEKVCLSTVSYLDEPTGIAFITVDDQGENTIVVTPGANAQMSPEIVNQHAEAIIETAALGLCMEIPYPAVRRAAEIGWKTKSKVVCNFSPVTEVEADFWQYVDVLLVNEHEAKQLLEMNGVTVPAEITPDSDLVEIRSQLQKLGIENTIITFGAAGACVLTAEKIRHFPGLAVDVVDTTGCGDAFTGAILAALASEYDLMEAAEIAIRFSAYAATGEGAQASYGKIAEINRYFSPYGQAISKVGLPS